MASLETASPNRYGPDAHATDYPPVFLKGKLPEPFSTFRWREDLYIIGQSHVPSLVGPGITVLHVDGAAVFDGTFCTVPTDFTIRCEDQSQLIDRLSTKMRGAAALYVADEHATELLILPDQLSAALLFTYSDSRIQAASTSLRALVRTLRAVGASLTKSQDFFVELLASDAGGYTPSSYEEIETAPQHSYVVFGPSDMSYRSYASASATPLVETGLDYEEHLHLAAEEITENAAAAATMPGTLTAHLTAGADSRLVGAALTAAGVADKFVFFCGANAVTREQDIAQLIAGHMGWMMTHHPGTATATTVPGTVQGRQATLEAAEGVKTTGPTEGQLRSRGLVLTGYNGEALKSFYSGRVETLTPGAFDAETFLRAVWPKNLIDPEAGLVRPEAVERIRSSVQASIDDARDRGVPVETIGDYLYLKSRNRYFAWHSAMEGSRYRAQFTPLYSPAMVRLAMSMPLAYRTSGRITFDLFRLLAPRTLEVPFDAPKFRGDVGKKFDAISKPDPSSIPVAEYDARTKPKAAGTYRRGKVVTPTRAHVERARGLTGVTAADVANEEMYRTQVRRLVLGRDSPVTGVLRDSQVRRLTGSAANTRYKVRTLGRLASYLPWYTDLE